MKKCNRCQEEKSLSEFSKNLRLEDGLERYCKDCNRASCRAYYQKNKEKTIVRVLEYHKNNPEVGRKARREYGRRNRQKMSETSVNWVKKKRADDPIFRFVCAVRKCAQRVAKAAQQRKALGSIEYLGCSIEEFIIYIEGLFTEGMTWENYGRGGWCLDHVIPIDYFVKNDLDIWKANHYLNLQPLWWEDNLKKSNKVLQL